MQVDNHNPANPEQITGIVSTNKGRMLMASNQPLPQQTRHSNQLTAINPTPVDVALKPAQEHSVIIPAAPAKTGTSWVFVFDHLLTKIKIRHYSPKILKAYRGWTRGVAIFAKAFMERIRIDCGSLRSHNLSLFVGWRTSDQDGWSLRSDLLSRYF
jgi:hypothetical protein